MRNLIVFLISLVLICNQAISQENLAYIDKDNRLVCQSKKTVIVVPGIITNYSTIKRIGNYGYYYVDMSNLHGQDQRNFYYIDINSSKIHLYCKQVFSKTQYPSVINFLEYKRDSKIRISIKDESIKSKESEISKSILNLISNIDISNNSTTYTDFECVHLKSAVDKVIACSKGSAKFGNFLNNPTFSTNGTYILYIEQKQIVTRKSNKVFISYRRTLHCLNLHTNFNFHFYFRGIDVDNALYNETNHKLLLLTKKNDAGLKKIYVFDIVSMKLKFIDYGFTAGWL